MHNIMAFNAKVNVGEHYCWYVPLSLDVLFCLIRYMKFRRLAGQQGATPAAVNSLLGFSDKGFTECYLHNFDLFSKFIKNHSRSRPYSFSNSLPPPVVGCASKVMMKLNLFVMSSLHFMMYVHCALYDICLSLDVREVTFQCYFQYANFEWIFRYM